MSQREVIVVLVEENFFAGTDALCATMGMLGVIGRVVKAADHAMERLASTGKFDVIVMSSRQNAWNGDQSRDGAWKIRSKAGSIRINVVHPLHVAELFSPIKKDCQPPHHITRDFVEPVEPGKMLEWLAQSVVIVHSLGKLKTTRTENTAMRRELSELRQRKTWMGEGIVKMFAHDVRTPLSVISQYASIMRAGMFGAVSEEQTDCLDTILMRSDALDTMLTDLVDLEAIDQGQLVMNRTPVSPDELLAPEIEPLRHDLVQAGCDLNVEISDTLPGLFCDVDYLKQALRAFALTTARMAGSPGQVALKVHHDAPGNQICFDLCSHNQLFSDDRLALINQALQPSASKTREVANALGLGAYVARRLLHANLGDVSIAQEPPHGLTFRIAMPVASLAPLLYKFLRRAGELDRIVTDVILTQLFVPPETRVGATKGIDSAIRSTIRSGDFLYRVRDTEWLVASPTTPTGGQVVLARLEQAMSALPGGDPFRPSDLVIKSLGSWSLEREKHSMVGKFIEYARPDFGRDRKNEATHASKLNLPG